MYLYTNFSGLSCFQNFLLPLNGWGERGFKWYGILQIEKQNKRRCKDLLYKYYDKELKKIIHERRTISPKFKSCVYVYGKRALQGNMVLKNNIAISYRCSNTNSFVQSIDPVWHTIIKQRKGNVEQKEPQLSVEDKTNELKATLMMIMKSLKDNSSVSGESHQCT